MASAGGIRAGRAFVEIGSNEINLGKGLDKALRRVKTFGKGVKAIGDKLRGFGEGLARIGTYAGIGFGLAARSFTDFESAMARLKALRNPTEEQFQSLSDLAKQLGRDTVFSATEAANAMAIFAQHGFSLDQIMKAVRPTLDLAATAQIGIAESAQIASTILRAMEIPVENLGNVIDILAKASTTANTDIMELGEAFKFVGPIAKSAKISLEEITAAIQILSNAGIQGEMAGTTLRAMILALGSPSKEAADAMAMLGVRVKDARGNFLPLVDVIAQFQRGLAGMGSAQRLEVLGKIFSNRAAAGAMELIAQGAEHLAEATAKLGDSSGTAARVAAVQLNTMKGAIKLLLSSVELLGTEIGAALAPALRKAGQFLMDFTNALSAAVKMNPALIMDMAKVTVGTIAAGAAFVAAGAALSTLGGIITFLATPFGLITAAATAAGVAFALYTAQGQQAVAQFLPTLMSLKDTAVQTFGGIADALKAGDLALAGKVFWAGLKVEWLKGVDYLMKVWAGFKNFVLDVWDGIAFAGAKAITSVFFALQREFAKARVWASGGGFAASERAGAAVDARRDEALGRLGDQQRLGQDARREGGDPEALKRALELADAEQQLKALTEQAGAKVPGEPFSTAPTNTPVSKAAEALPEITEGMNRAAAKADVQGTFNASTAGRLGAGTSVSSQLATQIEEAKKQTRQLEKLNDKARNGQLVFG